MGGERHSMVIGVLAALASVGIGVGWQVATRLGATTTLAPIDLALLRYGIPALVLSPLWWRSGLKPVGVSWRLLILMLLGVLPANIYSALYHVKVGGHEAGPIYLLVRVPFQLFVIGWTYFATEQQWLRRRQPERA